MSQSTALHFSYKEKLGVDEVGEKAKTSRLKKLFVDLNVV